MTRRLALLIALVACRAGAENLSTLAERPDWAVLEQFQGTITRVEFVRALDRLYAPRDAARGLIKVNEGGARIVQRLGEPGEFALSFAPDTAQKKPAPRFWRSRGELPAGKPLEGMRIALDPGHLGGEWARMEERWFTLGEGIPVTEGDLSLRVAELLEPKLRALGAEVLWVRRKAGPTTDKRPIDFFDQARGLLALQGITNPRETYAHMEERGRGNTVQAQAELLFYRQAEIRHRAVLVNERLKPDLVLCLHFNAEAWGDPKRPRLVANNHFHTLVNGCYSAGELRLDDNRFEMLLRLLGGIAAEEVRISTALAHSFARATALPPYVYTRDIAVQVNESPYVWARNLLANRLYRCPVVFLEPYVMNSEEIWQRVQAGEFTGVQTVAGRVRESLLQEYASAVASGLGDAMR